MAKLEEIGMDLGTDWAAANSPEEEKLVASRILREANGLPSYDQARFWVGFAVGVHNRAGHVTFTGLMVRLLDVA